MKIDCNVAKNYFKEKSRMTRSCQIKCRDCQLSFDNNKTNLSCRGLENICPDKAIEIVQKWSDEHQQETRAEHFLKMFPNAQMYKDEYPTACIKSLNENVSCEVSRNSCKKCWEKTYTEGEF